jgi:hypothetical protein
MSGLQEFNKELAIDLAYAIFNADPTFTTPEELAAIIENFLNEETKNENI